MAVGFDPFAGLKNLERFVSRQNRLTIKTLGDAVAIRNQLITHLEEANAECAAGERHPLLTFVVAGGGLYGIRIGLGYVFLPSVPSTTWAMQIQRKHSRTSWMCSTGFGRIPARR